MALMHHPVTNKEGKVVTTSVTNMDLHDLARNGRTFGVKHCFIVTPTEAQINMVNYLKEYWHEGPGASYNPDRKEAFNIIEARANIEETCLTIENLSGSKPTLVTTSAKRHENSVGYDFIQGLLGEDKPILLLFGTGFGLTSEFVDTTDYILEPIHGAGDYNHLPVRSAVAIILDRLVSRV